MIRVALAASILATLSLVGPANVQDGPSAADAGPGDLVTQSQPIRLGQPFTLKFGETAQLADDPLAITFNSVVEDSRCPVKVQCVWAGRVIVGLTAAIPDGPKSSFDLQLGGSQGVLTYNVEFNEVEPVKTSETQPSDESYVVTLTVHAAQ
jgi:hypothetical protein